MAASILNDLVILLNQQITFQEALTQQLFKIGSLSEVLLNTKFTDNPIPPTQYNCSWVLCELIQDARRLSEHAFDTLLKNKNRFLH